MNRNVSRRALVVTAAAGTVIPLAPAAATATVMGALEPLSVTALVVRVSPSKVRSDALRIGVRVTARLPADRGVRGPLVLVIDPVPFGLSAAETRDAIAGGIRARLERHLPEWDGGGPVAIQVFGGVLG